MSIPSNPVVLRVVTSKTNGELLTALARRFEQEPGAQGVTVKVEGIAGEAAAARMRSGQEIDVVVVAADTVKKLVAEGVATLPVPVVVSMMSLAVRAGQPKPDVSTTEAVTAALMGAESIGYYKEGPSGKAFTALLQSLGLFEALQPKLVDVGEGVGVHSAIASGAVTCGVQQGAELTNKPGVEYVGALSGGFEHRTVFSAAMHPATSHPMLVAELLTFLSSAAASEIKVQSGFLLP